jgi:hypothetical protein
MRHRVLTRMLCCPAPVAFQGLKAIAGEAPQILKARRGVQNFETLVSLSVEPLKLPDKFAARKRFGSFVAVAQNHAFNMNDLMDYVNRKSFDRRGPGGSKPEPRLRLFLSEV